MAITVNLVLLVMTIVSVRILRRYFGRTFDKKVKQIICVLVVFVLSYCIWSVEENLQLIHLKRVGFWPEYVTALIELGLCFFCDFLPITCVFLMHHKNYTKALD